MRITLTILSVLVTMHLSAQEYIVTMSGDTIKGKVSIRNKDIAVTGKDGYQISYPFSAVHNFYRKKTRYKVVRTSLSLYSANLEDINKSRYTGDIRRDTTIILKEVYTTPKMKLFRGTDKDKSIYFFVQKPHDPVPVQLLIAYQMSDSYHLPNAEYRQDRSAVSVREQKIYVDQLRGMTASCTSITDEDFDEITYTPSALKNIIDLYNSCR